ncbi:MAG TPA: tetratricopeptide repeat protein [Chloroflexia bacterium]|jgi:predicted ATPase/DNA-binding XRE family transcriptional regulator
MSSDPSFGSWLKQQRKLLDLTQEMLGQRIGYSGRTLEKIESGERHASRQIAELLAQALDIPEDEHAAFVQFARSGTLAPTAGAPGNAPWKAPHRHTHNLPAERTGFIGREDALAHALDLLRHEDVRLLSMTGPPGIGKTRLSIQVAKKLAGEFEHGVFFVELASVRDPDLLAASIAYALQIRESATSPLLQSLKEHLKARQLILVLDNFEQLVEAAPLLGDLLSHSPHLKLIVSSREALRIYGEHNFPVHSLSLPGMGETTHPERLLGFGAIDLFVERARAIEPGFALADGNASTVVEICRALEGVPLAIELAAARAWDLSLDEIRAGLENKLALLTGGPRDLPARQQTLRGAVDWSYDLLSAQERALFRRISVFAGGCTLKAIEAVCNVEGQPSLDVATLAASLLNKSLLQRAAGAGDDRRYRMLEVIREYAHERLVESGEAEAAHHSHARYYAAFAEEAEPHLRGLEQAAWSDLIERDHDNLRAALDWSLGESEEGHRAELGLLLGGALGRFWEKRGLPGEGRHYLGRLLAQPGRRGHEALRAEALAVAGLLALYQGDFPAARALYVESLQIRREIGDMPAIAGALNDLGVAARAGGDYAYARALYEESLRIRREFGDTPGIASSLNSLGTVMLFQGDYAQARLFAQEGLRIRRELDSKPGIALSLHILGDIERSLGDFAAAGTLYEESLRLSEELGNKPSVANALHNLAHIAIHEGKPEHATQLFKQALTMYQEWDDKPGIVECLTGMAEVAVSKEQAALAARLFGAAEALAEATRYRLSPPDQIEYQEALAIAQAHLGEALFRESMASGRAMPLEEAIAYALTAIK